MRANLRVACVAVVVVAILALCLAPADASAGDRALVFQRCLAACRVSCETGQAPPLPWILRVTGWDCADECKYNCMHTDVKLRLRRGQPIVQYYGKWPFDRVLGCQEILSVVFSIANLVPHAYYLLFRRQSYAPDGYPLSSMLRLYSLVGINTWVWSAVFHARDLLWTERLDYFCATSLIVASLYFSTLRIFGLHAPLARVLLGVLLGGAFAAHVGYLSLVHFDYGYNMRASVAAGLLHSAMWLGWAATTRRPYRWKVVVATVLTLAAAAFELLDFPPIWGLLDAHALWHALTPPMAFMLYSFLEADTAWNLAMASKRAGDVALPLKG